VVVGGRFNGGWILGSSGWLQNLTLSRDEGERRWGKRSCEKRHMCSFSIF
jgi:hypothetical protein